MTEDRMALIEAIQKADDGNFPAGARGDGAADHHGRRRRSAGRRRPPRTLGRSTDLSQRLSRQGRDADGERILGEALARMPDDTELRLALGLNLVRQHRPGDALAEIARAAEIDPGNARYAYIYAVALNSAGRTDDAIKTLEANHGRHPADRDTLLALVTINRDVGRNAAALTWADALPPSTPRPDLSSISSVSPPLQGDP